MKYVLLILSLVLIGCDRADEHAGHDHGDHAGRDDHDDYGSADAVILTDAQLREFGIDLAVAETGSLAIEMSVPGEVTFNPDRVVHVSPRVPGVVREVHKTVGDTVSQGETLAVLDSRELARLKAEYLAALQRVDIAIANHDREQALWKQNITPQSQYLQTKQDLAEARIRTRVAERELHAVGLSEDDLAALPEASDAALTRYAMTAPLGGTIVERHITRGEVMSDQPHDPPFVLADLSNVWVHLTVYPKDLDILKRGQRVTITTEHGTLRAEGAIDYISPSVGAATRSATARVVVDNPDRRWRPGLFVTGRIETDRSDNRIVVPRVAVQNIDDAPVLFVKTAKGYVPRPVTLGRRSGDRVEIVDGLTAGETYAATNTFTLKAELNRAALEHAGHVH